MTRIATIPWAVCALLSVGAAGAADADPRFAGTWQGTVKTGAGSTTLHVVMLPDSTFTTVIASESGNMRIVGTYQVLDGHTIRFVNRDYAPRESCGPGDGGERVCTSIDLPAEETDSYAFENGGQTLVIANPEAGEMRFERVE